MVPQVTTTKDALAWVTGMTDAEAAAFVASAVGRSATERVARCAG